MLYKRIVVKIGTSTITAGGASISFPQLIELARQVAALQSEGHEIVLVTSGAVAAGREVLRKSDAPQYVSDKQMLSAIGQPQLMSVYSQIFGMYGKNVSQILLTHADLSDRKRYLNAYNTFEALLGNHIIPIVNENDTLATEEIRVGDNDNLSAHVSNLVGADLLILLTDQNGLFTADPRSNPDAVLIDEIDSPSIDLTIWNAAGASGTKLGTGGMITKLQAADFARRGGTRVVIANGSTPNIISKIINGEKQGTHLLPVISRLENRKRYILSGIKNSNELRIDDGAAEAIRNGGSLLPVGILDLKGKFGRGDTLVIKNGTKKIALGLASYSSEELKQIQKHHSNEIEQILGYTLGNEAVHHNNMMLL